METRRIKLKDLPDFLMQKGEFKTLSELARELKITRATLHNWKSGSVNSITYSVRNKLAKTLLSGTFGFKVSRFAGDVIELSFNDDNVEPTEEILYLNNKVNELQKLLNKLVSENFVLKEKIEKYEVKK